MSNFDCDLAMDLLPSYLEKKTGEDTIGKLVEDEKVQGVVKEVMDKAKDIDPKDIDPKDIKGTIEKIVKD